MGGKGSGKKPATLVDEDGRVCTKCGEFKEWKFYYKKQKGGRHSKCAECNRTDAKKRRENT